MARRDFDVVILGSGEAARAAAIRCQEAGRRVAVVDSRPFGGTTALRGSDPKRVLLWAAKLVDERRRLAEHGVRGSLGIDWPALVRFKRTFTEPVPDAIKRDLHARDIATVYGRARFLSDREVQVGSDVLCGEQIVIATGARPRALGIPGAEHVVTSDTLLDLLTPPGRVVLVGGGYVSFELAHLCARAGCDVTLLDDRPRPLPAFDADLVDRLVERTRGLGVHVDLDAEVVAVERPNRHLQVQAILDGRRRPFEADLVVHGAGRVPEIDDLDLDKAGVAHSPDGILVDAHLRSTTNPHVWAAGDAAASGPPLTPTAALEGEVVGHNLCGGEPRVPDYRGVAHVCFTVPPLARVGLSEEEARDQAGKLRVVFEDTATWFSARRQREPCAAFKVLVDDENDRILGAHVLGPTAIEVVNLFALAIRAGVPASAMKHVPFAYPTGASEISRML